MLVLLASTAFGCRGRLAPVYTPQVAASYAGGAALKIEQVRAGILAGVAARRWTVNQEHLGSITATYQKGNTFASVIISYNEGGFTIQHLQSSPDFRFDGARVRKRYNTWVQNLERSISRELERMPSQPPPPPIPVQHAPAAPAAVPAHPTAAPAQPTAQPIQPISTPIMEPAPVGQPLK